MKDGYLEIDIHLTRDKITRYIYDVKLKISAVQVDGKRVDPFMFSQTAEYALRAAVAMAQDPEKPLTTMQIAEQTKVPPGYLSKILQTLTRARLIKAIRGLHGGYQLRRPAAQITILEVINAVDPIERIRTCPLELPDHGECLCPLHQRMDDALAQVEQALAASNLAEIVNAPTLSIPLCAAPRF